MTRCPAAPEEQPAISATARHPAAVSVHARREGLPRCPTPYLSTLAGCANDLVEILGKNLGVAVAPSSAGAEPLDLGAGRALQRREVALSCRESRDVRDRCGRTYEHHVHIDV